jgi:hypothetical protein
MPNQARVRLALDQNFPVLVLNAEELLPELEIAPVHRIDRRLSDLDDRKLLIALRQLGWHGLITNNYKMLWVPTEIAAVLKTKLAIFAVQGVGDDPLRATGAVLLQLPAVVRRLVPGKGQIFRVNPRSPQPEEPWEYFKEAANRHKADPEMLYSKVKVTYDELISPVLGAASQAITTPNW